MDLEQLRKIAGMPLLEKDESKEKVLPDATKEHVKNEKELFQKCHDALHDVIVMAERRLQDKELSDLHTKQYNQLLKDARGTRDIMKAHLATYK